MASNAMSFFSPSRLKIKYGPYPEPVFCLIEWQVRFQAVLNTFVIIPLKYVKNILM